MADIEPMSIPGMGARSAAGAWLAPAGGVSAPTDIRTRKNEENMIAPDNREQLITTAERDNEFSLLFSVRALICLMTGRNPTLHESISVDAIRRSYQLCQSLSVRRRDDVKIPWISRFFH
jgi:hypothetical protein